MVIFSLGLIYQEFFKMIAETTKTVTARIEVQQRFCNKCSMRIKKELQKIDHINHIRLYPKESMVMFNFIKADKLSAVLNTLSEIGYPEKGERINLGKFSSVCHC